MSTPTKSSQEGSRGPSRAPLGAHPAAQQISPLFADRHDAGKRLAALLHERRFEDPLVIGIARGGMPVAAEVARTLGAPLDIVVVRKIGVPWNRELAIGAVAEDGLVMVDRVAVGELGLSPQDVDAAVANALEELADEIDRLRCGRPRVGVHGRTVILVDDGLATGRIAQAAINALRKRGALRITLALPVAAPESLQALAARVDDAVCAAAPRHLRNISQWYEDFRPTSDQELLALLCEHTGTIERSALIEAAGALPAHGQLFVPWSAPGHGVIVFAPSASGGASADLAPLLAARLQHAGFATLTLAPPQADPHRREDPHGDVTVTAALMRAATDWLRSQPESARLPIGYLAGGAAAAGAVVAAARLRSSIGALVAYASRLDLAGSALAALQAPTLLIVPEQDRELIALTRAAREAMRCESRIALLTGRSPLALAESSQQALAALIIDWFARHISEPPPSIGSLSYECFRSEPPHQARSVISGARTNPRDNPPLPLQS
jgi:putative phosphoribosyl transferase